MAAILPKRAHIAGMAVMALCLGLNIEPCGAASPRAGLGKTGAGQASGLPWAAGAGLTSHSRASAIAADVPVLLPLNPGPYPLSPDPGVLIGQAATIAMPAPGGEAPGNSQLGQALPPSTEGKAAPASTTDMRLVKEGVIREYRKGVVLFDQGAPLRETFEEPGRTLAEPGSKPKAELSSLYIDVDQLSILVLSVLSPDLLKKERRGRRDPLAGHCYAASEALYHLLGGKEAGWKPMFIRHQGSPHWFLRHDSGRYLDVTVAQFSRPVPYERARGNGFLTKGPSARAAEIIRRVQDPMAGERREVYKVIKNGGEALSLLPGRYAGWKAGKIFGRLDCKSGMRMKKGNRVFFLTWGDALAAGYRPCKRCRPKPIHG